MESRFTDPGNAWRAINGIDRSVSRCGTTNPVARTRGLCCEAHDIEGYWRDANGGGGLDVLEQRAFSERAFKDLHDSRSAQGLASADATLDEAFNAIEGIDRNSLPPEVNQFIDLAAAALKVVSSDMADEGIPDPDSPNGSVYSDDDSANAMAWG